MIDPDNDIKWIPLTFLMFTVFLIISMLYVGGMRDISANIDSYDQGKFRLAVVMENTLTMPSQTKVSNLNYHHRRGVIPKKFFNQEIDSDKLDKPGYNVSDSGDCGIPSVAGLDGKNFGFALQESMKGSGEAAKKCNYNGDNPSIMVPIQIVQRENYFNTEKSEDVDLTIYEID